MGRPRITITRKNYDPERPDMSGYQVTLITPTGNNLLYRNIMEQEGPMLILKEEYSETEWDPKAFHTVRDGSLENADMRLEKRAKVHAQQEISARTPVLEDLTKSP